MPRGWAWRRPDARKYEAAFNALGPWAGRVPAAKVKERMVEIGVGHGELSLAVTT